MGEELDLGLLGPSVGDRSPLREAATTQTVACIEATCNQVNEERGYTGMTSSGFSAFVLRIAALQGFYR